MSFTSPAENWAPNPVTFTSQTNVALQVTTSGFVTLDAAADPPANNPTRCFFGGTETCQMEWLDTGFVIDAPNHVSATEPNGTVAAVRTDDEDQTCAAAFGNESREVGFWSNYLNPSTGTLPVAVNGIGISESSPGTGVVLISMPTVSRRSKSFMAMSGPCCSTRALRGAAMRPDWC